MSEGAREALRRRLAAALGARLDDLRLALSALGAHRLRAGLTLLGIVIGVFTVVAMMSLLNGLQASIDKNMGGLGADVFQIQRLPNFNFGALSPEIQRRRNLKHAHVLQLREALPQAAQVGGEVWEAGKEVVAGSLLDVGVQVAGGTPEFFTNKNLPLGTGRGYDEAEAGGAARVVVLGASVVDVLFSHTDPIGQHVRLGRLDLEVIGTLERQGGSPLGGNNPDNLSNDSARATFDQLANTVTAAGFVICAFTLIVGGIGVMNIMLVAVTERTREIGLRKALGARRRRVLMQFVIEAVLLAFLGGVLGVLLAYAATLLGRFLDFPAEVPTWAVALGLGVSSGIGLLAGIYPAWRASRLDPAVALRLE